MHLDDQGLLVRPGVARPQLDAERVQTHALTSSARVVDGQITYPGEPELFA